MSIHQTLLEGYQVGFFYIWVIFKDTEQNVKILTKMKMESEIKK